VRSVRSTADLQKSGKTKKTTEARYPLPECDILPGTSAEIFTSLPSATGPFLPRWFYVPAEIARCLLVIDVKVGNNSQISSTACFPASLFARPERTWGALCMDRMARDRDGFRCQLCGERFPSEDLTFDHVVPRSRGGLTTWDNIVTACVRCNTAKGDRTPAEARMRLLRPPKKPAYLPAMTVKMDVRHIPDEWRPYWTAVLDV
jgi:hypothetical protein